MRCRTSPTRRRVRYADVECGNAHIQHMRIFNTRAYSTHAHIAARFECGPCRITQRSPRRGGERLPLSPAQCSPAGRDAPSPAPLRRGGAASAEWRCRERGPRRSGVAGRGSEGARGCGGVQVLDRVLGEDHPTIYRKAELKVAQGGGKGKLRRGRGRGGGARGSNEGDEGRGHAGG